MKTKINLISAILIAIASSLYADISNTNLVTWDGNNNAVNTSYNSTGDPFEALSVEVTVSSGYQFDLNSADIFLGYSGGGLGGAPSPYMEIVDSLNNVIATTPTVPMTTAANGFYNITSYATALSYQMTFTPSSTVNLDPGTYNFQIWDTGQQLQFMSSGGVINATGVSVTMGVPYSGAGSITPALSMSANIVAAPEPSTCALVLMGLAGFAFVRRIRPIS